MIGEISFNIEQLQPMQWNQGQSNKRFPKETEMCTSETGKLLRINPKYVVTKGVGQLSLLLRFKSVVSGTKVRIKLLHFSILLTFVLGSKLKKHIRGPLKVVLV